MSRLFTRGEGVEAPANTFTLTTSKEQILATGLGEVQIIANTDGSFTADIAFTFLFPEPAADFKNDTEWVLFCGDYKLPTSALPAAAGSGINDTLSFGNAEEFDYFLTQLRADFSMELKLK